MMKLLLLALCLLFAAQLTRGQLSNDCFGSEFRIRNRIDISYPNDDETGTFESFYGVLDICYNDTYTTVCNSSDVDPSEVARIACQYLGYTVGSDAFSSVGLRNVPTVIDSIDCPDFTYEFSSCSLDVTDATECDFDDDLYVLCTRFVQSPSYCDNHLSITLNDQAYFNFDNNARYEVGFPVLCINNTLTPFCQSITDITLANIYCSSESTASVGVRIGEASDYQLEFTPEYVLTSFNCSDVYSLSSCEYDLSETCPSGSYGLISCFNGPPTCNRSDLFASNSVTKTFPTSRASSTFRVEICSDNGERIDVCNDGSLDEQSIASLACSREGYDNGEIIQWDSDTYESSDSGLYAVNVNCTADAYSFSQCNYSISEKCSGTPLVVMCNRACSSAQARLYNSSTGINSNNSLTITGILEVCEEGEWATLCDDGSGFDPANQNAIERACDSMGYAGGRLVSPDPATYGYSESTLSLVDVECPANIFNFNDCTFNISQDAMCTDHSSEYLLQCTPVESNSCYSVNNVYFDSSSDSTAYVNFPNGTNYYIGYFQICTSEYSYAALCSNVLEDNLAEQLCRYRGYETGYVGARFGSKYDYYPLLTENGVNEYNCSDFYSIYQCESNFTEGVGCSEDGGPGLVTCIQEQRPDSCTSGSRFSSSGYGTLSSGDSVDIGNVEVCLNGTYAPVCSDFVNDDFAQLVCYNQYGSNYLGYPYPIVGNRSDYSFDAPSSSQGVYDINCTYTTFGGTCDYENLQYTQTGGCSQYGGHAIISCVSQINVPVPPTDECTYNGQVRLASQYRISPELGNSFGPEGVGGVIEICFNGTYTTVCVNDSFASVDTDTLGSLTCSQLGYPSQGLRFIFPGFFPNDGPSVIDYLNCTAFATDFSSCFFGTTSSGECASHQYDANIQCYNFSTPSIPECYNGQVNIAYNYTRSFTQYEEISGRLEICVDGSFQRVCGNEDASLNATMLVESACNDIGYRDGSSYSLSYAASPAIDYASCPDFFLILFQCNFSTTDSGSCVDQNVTSNIDITCRRDIPVAPSCYDGEVRLQSNYSNTLTFDDAIEFQLSGNVEVCYNGTFYGLCTSGDYDFQQTAELVCSSLGYTGNNTSYNTFGSNSDQAGLDGVNNVSCSENATSLSECSLTISDSSDFDCRSHFSDLSVTCSNRVPSCGSDLFSFGNQSSFTFANNTQVYTGRVEVCLDGSYVPVCRNAISYNELDSVCEDVQYSDYVALPGQYIGDFYDYQTGSTSLTVQSLSCPSNAVSISQCQYTTGYGCVPSEEVLTCIQRSSTDSECIGRSFRVGNSTEVFLPYGSASVTGRVEVCRDGEYVDVCNDTEQGQYFANRACEGGYEATIVAYDPDYSTARSGRSLIIDGQCNDIEFYGYDTCSNLTDFDAPCGGDNSPLVVQCDRECESFGSVRLVQTETTNYDNGTTGLSGILQFCNYNRWNTVCDNNLTDFETDRFCAQFGYTNGSLLYSNPGGDLNESYIFANLSCPNYYDYSPASCSIEFQDEDNFCDMQVNLYCYNGQSRGCYQGQVRLENNNNQRNYGRGKLSNGTSFRIGHIEVCINGSFRVLCNQDLSLDDVSVLCESATGYGYGYPGALYGTASDYLLPQTSTGIYNITCPVYETNFYPYSCSYSTTNDFDGCAAYDGAALVTCVDVPDSDNGPSCTRYELAEQGYGTFFNGTSFYVGRPQACVNGNIAPICESLNQDESVLLCSDIYGYYGARTSPTFGTASDYGTDDDATTVVTDLSCPADRFYEFNLFNCNQTEANSSDGCLSYEPQPVITCYEAPRPCEESSFETDYVTYSDEYYTTFFSVRYCQSSTLSRVCGDSNGVTDEEATRICQQNGYPNGFVSEDFGNQTSYPSTSQSLSDFMCSDDSFYNCSFNVVDSCSEFGGDLVIGCYYVSPVCFPGQITLLDGTYQFDNVSLYFIGYPALCINNSYVPVCSSADLGLVEARVTCAFASQFEYGFSGYPDLFTPPPLTYNDTEVVTSLSCDIEGNCRNMTATVDGSCDDFAVVSCGLICGENSTQLYNYQLTFTPEGLPRLSGIPLSCSGGGWVGICNDGTNDPYLPEIICQQEFGFRYGVLLSTEEASTFGPNPPGTLYTNNFVCPDEELIDLSNDCDFNLTYTEECLNGSRLYAIQCFDYRDCREGEIRLAQSQSVVNSSSMVYTSGYPVICISDELVPLCNSSALGLLELSSICLIAENRTYGFPGTPSFLSLSPFSDTNNNTQIVTDLTCDSEFTCTNTSVSTDMGCSANGGYAEITCAIVCENDDVRVYNQRRSYTEEGLLRVTGFPQKCSDGGWNSICNDGTNDPDIPNLACQYIGLRGGYLLPSNRALYGTSPPGTFYGTNVTCNDSLQSCDGDGIFSEECLSGNLEYVVECYNVREATSLTQEPQNVTLVQTASAVANFTCQFSGDPRPSVMWQYVPVAPVNTTVLITSGGQYSIENTYDSSNTITSTLTVSSVILLNAGLYICYGINGGPQAIGRASLTVIVAPTVTLTPSGQLDQTEGDSFTFTCTEAGSFPALTVIWFKDSLLVSPSSRVSIQSSTTQDSQTLLYTVQSVLTIDTLVVSDSGSYECRTVAIPTVLGSIVSNNIALDVQVRNECIIEAPAGRPSPCVNGYCIDGTNTYFCQCFDGFTGPTCEQTVTTRSPPVFVTQPSQQSVLLGDSANFTCIVTGEPQPSISWMRGGVTLTGEVAPYLIIPSVGTANRGFYTCQATNSEGTITSEQALLRIQNVAQYISILTVESTPARRRRQAQVPDAILNQARDVAIGRQVAPGAEIVALDGYIVNGDIQIVFTIRAPVTDSGRPDTTGVENGLNRLAAEVSVQYPTFSFSPVMRFDGCLPTSTTLFGSVTLDWPEIGAGENATLPCPCGNIADTTGLTATRMCQSDFVSISEWISPDIGDCQYDADSQALCSAAATDNPTEGAQVLSNITTDSSRFTVGTLGIASAFLNNLASSENLTTEVANNLVTAIDNMFSVVSSVLSSDTDASNRIIESVDSLTENIPLINGEASIVRPRIAIRAQVIDTDTFNGLSFSVALNNDGSLDDDSLSGEGEPTGSIEVPDDLLDRVGINGSARVGFGTYTEDNFFIQTSTESLRRTPVTVIIAFDVFVGGRVKIENLENPVTLRFLISGSAQTNRLQCTFWEPATATWSSRGCTTEITANNVECECDHLSSFTVVEEEQSIVPSPTPVPPATETPVTEEEYYTEPIIIVGCAVSIVLLLIAVISHIISPAQRYSIEGKTLICSHISLIVLYLITILAAIASYTDSDGFCGTFSGLFHYASLVYVMWLFSEGVIYVVKLRHGLGGNLFTHHLFPILFFLTLAIPLLTVIVSVAGGHDYYALDNAFCRPQNYPFYYGYIIPVAVIFVAANICIFVGCLTVLLKPMKGAETSYRKHIITPHLFAASILNLVILIAWIFGLVGTDYDVVGAASTATQYIFGFFLIIHAILVLVMTMLRTEDTRQSCAGFLNRITGRSGKYDFVEEIPRQKSKSEGDAEAIGLGSSGRFSREGSIKKKDLTAEDVQPLRASPDADEEQADTVFSSKAEEKKVEDEEEKKRLKEEEIRKMSEDVITNPAASEDPDDVDQKTDL